MSEKRFDMTERLQRIGQTVNEYIDASQAILRYFEAILIK
jgi:hypothetical protein